MWTDPDDATAPLVVVTIDKVNLQTRYRLWSTTEVWTYMTKQAAETHGGRVAILQSKMPHDYGCLPFSFCQYELPIQDFFPSSVGYFLSKAEVRIDSRLSQLDESIGKFLNPISVAEGVPDAWKPIVEANRFIRMPLAAPSIGYQGGYVPGDRAKLYYLTNKIDETGGWDDITRYMNQALEAGASRSRPPRWKRACTVRPPGWPCWSRWPLFKACQEAAGNLQGLRGRPRPDRPHGHGQPLRQARAGRVGGDRQRHAAGRMAAGLSPRADSRPAPDGASRDLRRVQVVYPGHPGVVRVRPRRGGGDDREHRGR